MTEYASKLFWNAIAPVADQSGAVIPGTLIKGSQEVVYGKIIRKISGYDKKSYMELVLFTLVTQSTDMGFGAWYGKHKSGKEAGFMDVLMEAIRPILSCLVVNYIFNTSYVGLHNPWKSFGFIELLIQLASKDLSTGGNAVLMQNVKAAEEQLLKFESMRNRMETAARFQPKPQQGTYSSTN